MLPDVSEVPQTTAGGQFPQDDCYEDDASSLLKHFASLPGVVQATVAQLEAWETAHSGHPATGTPLAMGAACLSAHGLPSRVGTQGLDDAASRGHYSLPLVSSTPEGIPAPNGSRDHYPLYLGDGWYRNPANGTLVNSPPLGPAYTGQCIEINVPAIATPLPAITPQEDEAMNAPMWDPVTENWQKNQNIAWIKADGTLWHRWSGEDGSPGGEVQLGAGFVPSSSIDLFIDVPHETIHLRARLAGGGLWHYWEDAQTSPAGTGSEVL